MLDIIHLLCNRYILWGHPHTTQLLPLLRSPLHIRAALSLAPAISVSPANGPSGLQQARLSQQATPTKSATPPMAEQTERKKPE